MSIELIKCSTARNIDIDESGDLVITGVRTLYGIVVTNLKSSTLYLKVYDKATAPTVGTDTIKMTIPIPATTVQPIPFVEGVLFSLGIGVGATTGVANNDTGAPGANECVATFIYT